jgi:hypothetical protein
MPVRRLRDCRLVSYPTAASVGAATQPGRQDRNHPRQIRGYSSITQVQRSGGGKHKRVDNERIPRIPTSVL